ncbi:MAG: hypothetical protein Kow00121_41700 [Elainellaceae cyanobacterium]
MAIVNTYSTQEKIEEWSMSVSDTNTENLALTSWVWIYKPSQQGVKTPLPKTPIVAKPTIDPFKPVRRWLDSIEIKDANFAHSICKLIPAQCPFERDVTVFGYTLFRIPPMCKLNPVYDEVVALRFRALCYLADVCGEDITAYC